MKTIIKYLVLIICFVMIGCTIRIEPKKSKLVESTPSTDNVSVEKISKWNPEKKQFWISMVFAKMAQNPQIRQMLKPRHLYQVVICSIDQYEKEYDLDYFEKYFGWAVGGQTAEHSKVSYIFTYGCIQKQLPIQQQELLENPPNPKDRDESKIVLTFD